MNSSFHLNFDQDLNNPMMTSVAVLPAPAAAPTSNDFCDDMDLGEGTDIYGFNTDLLNSDDLQVILDDPEAVGSGNPVIDMPIVIEENETVMPSPTQNRTEDIFEIHSYSQKSENVVDTKPPAICKPAAPTVVKSKGKVGPPATSPKVQKKSTEVLKKVQSGRVTKRLRKPVKHFDESSADENEENDSDYEVKTSSNKNKKSVNSSSSTSKSSHYNNSSNRKVKLYEQEAFSDPEMERCRQNAINAKFNRDRKNQEKNKMNKEMAKLKRENQDLKKKNQKYRTRLTGFESRLQILETFIRSNPRMDEMFKASGNADFVSTSINKNQFDEILSSNSSSGEEVVDEHIIYYDD